MRLRSNTRTGTRCARVGVAVATLLTAGMLSCQITGSPPAPTPTAPPATPAAALRSIMIIDITNEPSMERRHQLDYVAPGINITQGAIDLDNDGLMDESEVVARRIRKVVPEGCSSFVALDWEGEMAKKLKQHPSSKTYFHAVEELKKVLLLAKQLRPQAKIGFYGLPQRKSKESDEQWRARCEGLIPVLKHADWIGPTLYPGSTRETEKQKQSRRAYINSLLDMSYDLARTAGDKPVYAWFNHRYHISNKNLRHRPLSDEDFTFNVRAILEWEKEGQGVEGIVWWGADRYFRRTGQIDDGASQMTDAAFVRLHDHCFTMLSQAVNEARYRKRNGQEE
jgi:hypothetical protein